VVLVNSLFKWPNFEAPSLLSFLFFFRFNSFFVFRVIATVGSDDKAKIAKSLGADEVRVLFLLPFVGHAVVKMNSVSGHQLQGQRLLRGSQETHQRKGCQCCLW
jgi:hypothetical protein